MATAYNAVNVKCPFYISEDKQKITCDGPSEGCTNTLRFDNAKLKEKHIRTYCNTDKNCEECPVYQSILKKYDL